MEGLPLREVIARLITPLNRNTKKLLERRTTSDGDSELGTSKSGETSVRILSTIRVQMSWYSWLFHMGHGGAIRLSRTRRGCLKKVNQLQTIDE